MKYRIVKYSTIYETEYRIQFKMSWFPFWLPYCDHWGPKSYSSEDLARRDLRCLKYGTKKEIISYE